MNVNPDVAEELIWNFYKSNHKAMSEKCWGKVYAQRHKELIDQTNNYAAAFNIILDQTKFYPVGRHMP